MRDSEYRFRKLNRLIVPIYCRHNGPLVRTDCDHEAFNPLVISTSLHDRLSRVYWRIVRISITVVPIALQSALFLGIILSGVAVGQSRVSYRTVALTGQPALGPGVAAYYSDFFSIWLGDGGHVTFAGSMNGAAIPTFEHSKGIWAGRPAQVTNVMRGGVVAPGVDGALFFFLYPVVNAQGKLAISANIDPSVGLLRDHVLWTGMPGDLRVAAREGDHAPGTEPTTVFGNGDTTSTSSNFQALQFDDTGQLTFIGELLGPGVTPSQSGLWSGLPDDFKLIVRSDSQADGLPAGANYLMPFGYAKQGSLFAFKSHLRGGRVNQLTDVGVWLGTPDNFQLVAREGDLLAGRPSVAFAQLAWGDPVQIDAGGRALFSASLVGRGVNEGNDFGYWISGSQGPELLFAEGDAIPGMPGAHFSDLSVRLGPANQYAIVARLRGDGISNSNDSALFLGTPGNLKLIAREGTPAPGAPPGVLLGDMNWFTSFTPAGQFAFANVLTGSGVTTVNDVAYYLSDANHNLFLVAREGNLLDVGGGNLKQISFLGDTIYAPSEATFNSQGELLFRAGFADGQGLFIANLSPQQIPEPSTCALAIVFVAIVLSVAKLRSRALNKAA